MGFGIELTTLAEVIAATAVIGTAPPQLQVRQIVTDTRLLQPGQVFLALVGDRFDGHKFLTVARERGAIAAIVSRVPESRVPESLVSEDAGDLPLLLVSDTLAAYQAIARWWRQQFPHPVVAVTGSVGKTTTKELIAAVLGTQGAVLKTQANFNNEIGVPKTLLELDPDRHQFAVIEMGMRAAGEIALLTQIAQPTIGVITNVGTAHIGRLGSEQAIAQAKCELLQAMPSGGTAILNYDNARLMATAAQVWEGETLVYGLTGGDVQGTLLDATTLVVDEMSFALPLPGAHNALNFLAALAVARAAGVDWGAIAQQSVSVQLPQGRAQRLDLPGDVVILDETYNAGLESMLAALRLLADTPATRRIAVLGTMKELGDRAPDFHHQVGVSVRQMGIDHLLVLADPAERDALLAGAAPLSATAFVDQASLVERLLVLVQPGDRLLFKASRSVELDQAVQQFSQRFSQRYGTVPQV
ncbi:MAG: UDP-N-acetylmuramoyl-tripeptide--D-alanyl-D-alanine ligase [Kaiparowitsia implicata GSE-PSE-MK54-09C]|jgi:UDP-N-acetylmuramoyl-tripeptide--D-alanyl-D-alanine ligase|nr:UDP-N-acetylmuramoyl-tripeptide--D-alanyl-D-alanine ligase [Kaiparowitsia implicata GSE-PSE-MK54-09C]